MGLVYSQISCLNCAATIEFRLFTKNKKKKKNGSRLKEISTIPLKPIAAVRNLSKDMRMRSRLSGLLLEGRRMQLIFFFGLFPITKIRVFHKVFPSFCQGSTEAYFFLSTVMLRSSLISPPPPPPPTHKWRPPYKTNVDERERL